jgi:Flp pilus assembly protein TadG
MNMRSLYKDISGNSAVEFALTAPVLLFMVLGALEYGMMFYTQASMQHAARDSVRQVSLGQLTDANAPAYVCGNVPSWAEADCSASVTHSNAADPKTDVITVAVNVPASKATVVNFFTEATGGDFVIEASAAMRREDVL